MEFRVLGHIEAADGGTRCPVSAGRQLALLALLLVHANRVLSADRILDELWGDDPPDSGAKTIGFHVSKLRDALAPGRERLPRPAGDGRGTRSNGVDGGSLLTLDGGYLLRVPPDALDAARFERLAGEGRAFLTDDPAMAADRLDAALAEWRGPAYAQVADAPFARAEIVRLEELRLRATEDAFDAALALGRHGEVIVPLAAHVDANPLREHARASLMTALYRAGRQAEALRAFADGRTILAQDLGIEPGPELRRLEALVLQQDPSLAYAGGPDGPAAAGAVPVGAAAPEVAGAIRNPYKGLRPFGEADADDFFGREALVASLLDRLDVLTRGTRLLALVGPSGSGKSSVIQAGLLPAIRAGRIPSLDGAPVATLLPGAHPVRGLARVLQQLGGAREGPPDGMPRLLVIDQLEEVPALAGEHETAAFLAALETALEDADPGLVVVLALRSDRLDLPLSTPGLADRVRLGVEIVGPLARDELERAITRPAERLGITVDPGLARDIAADVGTEAGALPLLQFALTDLFERRDQTRLTRAAYAASGGVAGALAGRAEDAWAALEEADRTAVRRLFLRLVSIGESGEPVGRRRPRPELAAAAPDAATLDRLLDTLSRRRLIALDRDSGSGDAVVQVAHDALLAGWPRLAGWIREARDDLAMRRRLADATAEWQVSGRDPGFLMAGSRLDLFAAWAATTELQPVAGERSLLDASLESRTAALAAESARITREHGLERRASTRLRALVAVLTAGIVAVSGLSIGLYRQGEQAAEQTRIAQAREIAAAALGNVGDDPRLALLLARYAAAATADLGYVTAQALDALHWALQASHVAYPVEASIGSTAAVRAGPDGPAAVPVMDPAAVVALADRQQGRALTEAECRTYLHLDRCSGGGQGLEGAASDQAPLAPGLRVLTADGVVPVEALVSADLVGTSVDLLSELPVDLAPALDLLAGSSGTSIVLTGGPGGALERRVAAGDEPDIAILARPRDVMTLARERRLVDLESLVDRGRLEADAGTYLVAAGSIADDGSWPSEDGRLFGAPLAVTDDSLLWVAADRSVPAPATWGQALDQIRDDAAQGGGWCMGLADTAGAGRPGNDPDAVFEDGLLLGTKSDTYDMWARGTISPTRFEARAALERVRDVLDPALLAGGLARAQATPPGLAAWPMLETPSSCLYHPGGGLERLDWYADPLSVPSAVPMPPSQGGSSADDGTAAMPPSAIRGHLFTVVVFHDRPEVRQVVRALVDEAGDPVLGQLLAAGGLWRPGSAVGPAPERAWLQGAIADGRFRVTLRDWVPDRVAVAISEGIARYGAGSDTKLTYFLNGVSEAWSEAWKAGETGLAGG